MCIRDRVYAGQEVEVSEYTMSEIIATIYETMEGSGIKEGILFLDEINCVSDVYKRQAAACPVQFPIREGRLWKNKKSIRKFRKRKRLLLSRKK